MDRNFGGFGSRPSFGSRPGPGLNRPSNFSQYHASGMPRFPYHASQALNPNDRYDNDSSEPGNLPTMRNSRTSQPNTNPPSHPLSPPSSHQNPPQRSSAQRTDGGLSSAQRDASGAFSDLYSRPPEGFLGPWQIRPQTTSEDNMQLAERLRKRVRELRERELEVGVREEEAGLREQSLGRRKERIIAREQILIRREEDIIAREARTPW